mmetsp:Transcript_3881/g.14113  ORF Transcript_3881/g.14113 Transcript_3881/m.14113 type:complete len:176 (+) Transcript_3881:1330-1857(+)
MPLVATQKRSWFALSLQQTLILKRCSTIRRSCSVMQFKQTVGTLRYADRAKQIKNKPKVNIDPTEMLIQQLKEENERLKQQMGTGGGPPGTVMTEEEKEAMKKQLEDEMAAKMAENEKMLAEMSKSWEEKLKEAQEKVRMPCFPTLPPCFSAFLDHWAGCCRRRERAIRAKAPRD